MKANPNRLLRVGILDAKAVRISRGGQTYALAYAGEGCLTIGDGAPQAAPFCLDGPFTIHDVIIGKQFHWQQSEDQTFRGSLRVEAMGGLLRAINEVDVETYLKSVISSEMSATNSLELLKAHAVISRSWVLRQLLPREAAAAKPLLPPPGVKSGERVVSRIWDHDDHAYYDVCADDHCQRYQGITREVSELVAEAVDATRGMVLLDAGGEICDTRFYKACGGHTERFSACWQDRDFAYLAPRPDACCSPAALQTLPGGAAGVLRLILNGYDRTTPDYHVWTEHYTAEELSDIVESRLQLGLGRIVALEPLERGASGRIVWLRIVGAEGSVVVGKELLVRKVLSRSHLKSSWFDVETLVGAGGRPHAFVLHGHGWGHGVGLCQIGAAAMSLRGFTFDAILRYYFAGTRVAAMKQPQPRLENRPPDRV